MKVTISSVLLLAAATPALAANFLGSCSADSVVVDGKILTAKCRTISGQLKCTKLDLNNCLKNTYGSLQSDPEGDGPHFGDQCYNCSNDKTTSGILIDSPGLLHCQCDPGTGAAKANWPTAIFDINTIVDNFNGRLECYGNKAKDC